MSHSSLIYSPGTYKTSTRKIMDPRNTYEKKFQTHEKKFGTHEIPTRKNYGPTKARWHDGTRPTEFSTLIFVLSNTDSPFTHYAWR